MSVVGVVRSSVGVEIPERTGVEGAVDGAGSFRRRLLEMDATLILAEWCEESRGKILSNCFWANSPIEERRTSSRSFCRSRGLIVEPGGVTSILL